MLLLLLLSVIIAVFWFVNQSAGTSRIFQYYRAVIRCRKYAEGQISQIMKEEKVVDGGDELQFLVKKVGIC